SVALDSLGNVYVAGNTASNDFPATPNSIPSCRRGANGPFVAELDPNGQRIQRATLLSGIGYDVASGLALDRSTGTIYVAGTAQSRAFLSTGAASQPAYAGGNSDAFVSKINWNGTAAVYVACALNAASFTAGNQGSYPLGTVAPGEIVSIFGVGLGPAQAVTSPVITSAHTIATSLGGTQVFFDGVAAPVLYVGQ